MMVITTRQLSQNLVTLKIRNRGQLTQTARLVYGPYLVLFLEKLTTRPAMTKWCSNLKVAMVAFLTAKKINI